MKAFAFWFPVVCVVLIASPAVAQRGGRTSALGGSLAPRGAMSHPLGGFTSSNSATVINRGYRGTPYVAGRRPYIVPFGYSYYVPNYFGSFDSDAYYDPGYGYGAPPPAAPYPPDGPPTAPPQPVIINQYFGMPAPPPQDNGPDPSRDVQGAAGDVLGSVQNYYLIAYKNHAIYAALAYWVEDKTLHYVTTQNTHNQASIDLIDLDLTKSLNQSRDVPFAIAGR
jgi:hypothetical protein